MLRGLLIGNLISIHIKKHIGPLSAFCGAVSAGAGAAGAFVFLSGGTDDQIGQAMINVLGDCGGMVCDGAKSSCAAKIAMAVEAGIFGYEMFKNGQQFYDGDGLVVKGVENSIANFSRLGRVGMRETDREIILMMTNR
jgi:L-cysteine desulfidase